MTSQQMLEMFSVCRYAGLNTFLHACYNFSDGCCADAGDSPQCSVLVWQVGKGCSCTCYLWVLVTISSHCFHEKKLDLLFISTEQQTRLQLLGNVMGSQEKGAGFQDFRTCYSDCLCTHLNGTILYQERKCNPKYEDHCGQSAETIGSSGVFFPPIRFLQLVQNVNPIGTHVFFFSDRGTCIR